MPNTILLKLLLLAYLVFIGKSTLVSAADSGANVFVTCWLLLAVLFASGQFSVRARKPVAKAVLRNRKNEVSIRQFTGG